MHSLLAQTTYTLSGKQIPEGSFHLFLVLLGVALLSLRLFAGRLDRARIRSHVRASGGHVLDIKWSPLGRGWFGSKGDRIYEVTYRTKAGKTITAACKTSMFSGVYWTSDTAPDSFPDDGSGSSVTECLSCGATLPGSTTRCPQCGWTYETSLPADRNA